MILKPGIWIAVYAVILYLGIRAMLKKRRIRDIFWYVSIVGWCAYISLGKLFGWPLLTLVTPINVLFVPVGKWIEQLMGGPPS